ncbi:unnamed protein product [Mytilus edulis]|uniref:Ricin B lectin domain-containing protein n=1 Tax=Mytilus edulis TaxID=6550 RepID=A0A8S3SP65_MYTED|nr:unnamed protein product [Mytilus edulis]
MKEDLRHSGSPRGKRNTYNDIGDVLSVIEKTTNKLRQKDTSFDSSIKKWFPNCSSVEDVETINFWKGQYSVYPMYLSLTTIGLYSIGCSYELDTRVHELINLVDKPDAIDFLEQIGEDDFQFNLLDNITENVDIDDEVNIQMVEGSDLVADNIDSISLFSDIMQNMNSSTARSIDGLDSILDETINEYDVLSKVLDSDFTRKKRSVERTQQSTLSTKLQVKKFHSNKIVQQHLEHKRQQLLGKFINDNINIGQSNEVVLNLKTRYKRSVLDTYDLTATPFFLRNSMIPCKILMIKRNFDQFYLTFDNYDKENMYKQLWILVNGTIQNYETDFFLDVDSKTALSKSIPALKLFTNGYNLRSDDLKNNCVIEVKYDSNRTALVTSCESANQIWYFIPYESSEENFNELVCFYFIQSNESCLVLTENTETANLVVQNVNKENIERQIWYWDGQYIRNAHNHEYLSSATAGSSIRALPHDGDINQKWKYQNGYLHAVDIYGNVVLSSGSILTVEHQDNSSYQQWSMVNTELDEVTNCITNKSYFVIKNTNMPCKVLCTISDSTLPSLLVQTGIAAGFIAIGIVSAVILYYKFEKSFYAFSIGVAAGLVMTAISLSVINLTSLFKNSVTSLTFDYFDDKYPQKCTWYNKDSSILNLESDQAFYKSDDSSEIKLTDDKSQKWHLENGNIESLSSPICYITFDTSFQSSCVGKVEKQWSIVRYDNSLDFFNEVRCLYYLKQTSNDYIVDSKTIKDSKSCGMLTEIEGQNDIEIHMPSTDLFLNQMWYYSGSELVNLNSGNALPTLIQGWTPIELNASLETPGSISCRSNLFFIRSKTVPCKVLEQNPENGALEFQIYDEKNLSRQLWLYNSDAIINYETGLYLSSKDMNAGSTTFLSNKSSILYQNWTIENQHIIKTSHHNTSCFLNVQNESHIVDLDCSINGTNTSIWELTPYDTNFDFLGNVLCTYFIQSEKEPCELLTGNKNSSDVVMRPASEELFMLQLWYTLNNQIVHLDSGRYLGVFVENDTSTQIKLFPNVLPNTTWSLEERMVIYEYKTKGVLTVHDQDGSLTVTQYLDRSSNQYWRFLESKYALDNIETLSCMGNDSNNFFIKVNSVDCKVLTATSKGQTPVFEQFDETKINLQLWQWKFAYLVNVETGLSLHLDTITGDIILQETKSYYLRNRQILSFRGNIVSGLKDQQLCGLITHNSIEDKPIPMCNLNYAAFKWAFIDYDIALSDVSNIMCVYFIRTKETPCEYLTGFGHGNSLKVRPIVHELVQNQLFYWEGSHIIHMKTGLRLTSNHTALVLGDAEENSLQSWYFVGYRLETFKSEGINSVYFNPLLDGKAFVGHNTTSMPHKWIFQEMSKTLDGNNANDICEDNLEINSTFFIKNTEHPCLILTSGTLGNSPEFRLYDENRIHGQLWYFQENHIVNVENGLSLMMDIDKVNGAYSVNMWHYYSFSTLQMWDFTMNSDIKSKSRNNCLIVPNNEEKIMTIKSSCNVESHSKWQYILMDKQYNFFNEITCMFFIQTLVTPCELLTGFGLNKQVRLRPVDPDNINAQLWYWDGNHLLNADSGLALTAIGSKEGSKLSLQNKNAGSTDQMWNHEYTFFTLFYSQNVIIGISVSNGDVKMYQKNGSIYKKWKLIDREEGIEKPHTLQCVSNQTSTDVYYIRSEYDECPLLSSTDSSYVGVRMLDSGPLESKGWIKENKHIINLKNVKSLSISSTGILILEDTFAFERRQFWQQSSDFLYSWPTSERRVMTYESGYIRNYPLRSNTNQKWKWYTVDEIEKNDKLLRCSRCYNAGEETANNVISYIPFFSWFYSAIRAIVYAVKNCPKVAWDTFKSFAIDFAIDAAIALITVVSAGTLSALALGIKTGIQAGFKAGIKAAFRGMKSMIKVSIKAFKNMFKTTLKRGFTKTLRAKFTTMKRSLTNSVKIIKSIPKRLKAITTNVVKQIKTTSKQYFKKVPELIKRSNDLWNKKVNIISRIGEKIKVTLKNFPENIKRTLKNTGKKTKSRMRKLLDKLAEPAEKAIKQLDEIKFPMKQRCRRMIGGFCSVAKGQTDNDIIKKAYQFEGSTDLPTPKEIKTQYNQLLKDVDKSGQTAVIGVKQSDNIIYKQSSKIDDLRQSGKKPIPKDKIDVTDISNGNTDVRHTEQDLFINVKDTLKDCTPQKRCDVFLYTKLSPCRQHPQSYARGCMDYIITTCKEWFKSQGIRCHVGFDKFYDDGIEIFKSSDWGDYFENTMGSTRKSKNDIKNLLKQKGYSEESLLYADKLIKENLGAIKTNLDEKLANEYQKLFKNIPGDFRDEYNTVLQYLKKDNPPVSSVVAKFDDVLRGTKIDNKKVKNIVQNFENKINRHNEVYIRELLNKISTERTVIGEMQNTAGGTSTDFIDFFNLEQ